MKAKKIFQTCLVLSGLLLSFSGVTCLVVATLLDHDSDLKQSHEARSRTYGTQYWLGIPFIAFGGLMMLVSPSLHKRKKMAVFNVCVCIPLLTCCLVGAILHGTAYSFFLSIHQNRLFMEDHNYICSDVTKESTILICQCTKKNRLLSNEDVEPYSVPCDQQRSLVGFHGVLFSLSAIAFALLLGILLVCVIFLLHVFQLQLAIGTSASGEENHGFSHGGNRSQSHSVPIDQQSSQYLSQTSLYSPHDHPPSYESLMGVTSPSVTNDVTAARGSSATVNRQARVRYRGQMNSRFSTQTQAGTSQEEHLSNEVFHDHGSEPQARANEASGSISTQGDQVTNTANTENGRFIPAEMSGTTHSYNETRHEPNETRSVPSRGEAVRIRDLHSNEAVTDQTSNFGLTPHNALEPTDSDNSEANVYIDITQNVARNPISTPSDPARVAVRYRGQLDSTSENFIQRHSTVIGEHGNTTDQQEGTAVETSSQPADSSNVINPQESTELALDSTNSIETTRTDTESPTELPSQLDNESIPPESNNLNSINLDSAPVEQRPEDARSEDSLEILSI